MRYLFISLLLFFVVVLPVRAQVATIPGEVVATQEAEASAPALPQEKVDLTQPAGPVSPPLEQVLNNHKVGGLTWYNFLRFAVQGAVARGLPVNTVVLVLLFPLIVAIVAASRHLIGMRGVGILTPALLSVAFLATGVWAGVGLFLVILLVASTTRLTLRRLKLQYLPRMALLLWFVSAGVLATLFGAAYYSVPQLLKVGIFPILILMLLAETFIDIQQGRSGGEARDTILQTLLLATISSLILASEGVQKAVLLWPEAIFFGVAVFDLILGKYTGLRLTEYLMYSKAVGGEEEE